MDTQGKLMICHHKWWKTDCFLASMATKFLIAVFSNLQMSKLSEAYVRSRKIDELLEINNFETFKNIITLQYLDSAKIADCNKIGQGKLKQMLAAASRISSQICLAIQPKTRISFDRSLRLYDFKTILSK